MRRYAFSFLACALVFFLTGRALCAITDSVDFNSGVLTDRFADFIRHFSIHAAAADFSPRDLDRIFRRFDRAHGKRSVGGSGLGLAIVDAITKGHRGLCVVTDTPGGGATFTIHLPPTSAGLPAPVRAGDVVLQREASE